MIAAHKSIPLFVLLLCSFILRANHYQDIAKEYDVNPPSLEWGYPAQFLENDSSIKAIIYLKEGLTDLHKLDDRTYVAEPTKENAEIIMNFTTEDLLCDGTPFKYGGFSYVVIADSSISTQQLDLFFRTLNDDIETLDLYLFGFQGRYASINLFRRPLGSPPFCGYRSRLLLELNSQDKMRVENQPSELTEIANHIIQFLTVNFENEVDLESLSFSFVQEREVRTYCNQLSHKLDEDTSELRRSYIKFELKKHQILLHLCEEFGDFRAADKSFTVQLKWQRPSIRCLYEVISEYNKGIYLARNIIANKVLKMSYGEILSNLKMYSSHSDLVELIIPNKLTIDYTLLEPEMYPWLPTKID